jgi:SAM-dependent methyltransferase
MTADAGGYKDAIRDQWAHAAGVWGKWHPKFTAMTGSVTQVLCDAAALEPGLRVLDLAGGTGEPSLSVAQRVAPGGSVTYSDFVPEMIAVAQEHARRANISNIDFRQVDAEDIPFEDNSYDRVVARFGVMFFPDMQRALAEVRRVLKPNGRISFVVWQAVANNPWFEELNGPLARRGLLKPPPPGMPGPFRFGEPGSLPRELRAAGFEDVAETPHTLAWTWPGPADEYLDFTQGTLPPVRKALEEAGAERDAVTNELLDVIRQHESGGQIHLESLVFAVTARNPA